MKTTNIYILIDPRNQQIRYVGKTNNPDERFKNHMNRGHNKLSHKRNWIESLKKLGLKPIMQIIDIVLIDEWIFWEKYWISQFKSWGFNLVNHTEGGDGCTFGNKTSFKKGHVPWNNDTKPHKTCIICGNIFRDYQHNHRNTCSKKCEKINRSNSKNSGKFQISHTPWNKNKSNYKIGGLKQSIPVLQLDVNTNEIINEFLGCKEAAIAMNCIPENIRSACVGKLKTAKGYKWKYKNE